MKLVTDTVECVGAVALMLQNVGMDQRTVQYGVVVGSARDEIVKHRAATHELRARKDRSIRLFPKAMRTLTGPARDNRVELKYVVDIETANRVRDWSTKNLRPDPHCDMGLEGGTYDVRSLYFDTPKLDVYQRPGFANGTKYRMRRYGSGDTIWLEAKQSRGINVSKRRSGVNSDVVTGFLSDPASQRPLWDGDWFQEEIAAHAVQPTLLVTYRRFARISDVSQANGRLTIDYELRARWATSQELMESDGIRLAITNQQVLELKYSGPMPYQFKQLLFELAIPASRFSKYRNGVKVVQMDGVDRLKQSSIAPAMVLDR